MSEGKTQLAAAGHVLLRTPLLPRDVLEQWAAAADDDAQRARAHLAGLLERPEVAEAIAVSSPAVAEGIAHWREQPHTERSQRLERALVGYVQRLASRPTPFGLFAGVSLGLVGRHTELKVSARSTWRRKVRLDLGVLHQACEQLLEQPEVRSTLRFTPNETAHVVGRRLHFVKGRQQADRRAYELSSVDALEVFAPLFAAARGGATLAELEQALLTSSADLTAGEVQAFLDQLVTEQLLLPELRPPLTGRDALDAVLEALAGCAGATELRQRLEQLREGLARLDVLPPGQGLLAHQAAVALAQPLQPEADHGRLLQVDLLKPGPPPTLSKGAVAELCRIAQLMREVFPRPEDVLKETREAFIERHETAEVPLLQALDDEVGISFLASARYADSPLLAPLKFAATDTRAVHSDERITAFLANLRSQAEATGQRWVEVPLADLERLARPAPALPESCALSFELLGTGVPHTQTPWALLHGLFGPSGESMLARFAWLDPSLERAICGSLEAEERLRPEVIFADVVHAPEGRGANIVARPCLRQWELPVLGRSGAPRDHQLELRDLTLSVRDGRFVLRSRSLGKEVVPRLTNAHNYDDFGFPLYRFLAHLQFEGARAGPRFDWAHTGDAPFLPRVQVRGVVLAPASWTLHRSLLEGLHTPADLQRLAKALGWPRHLKAMEGEQGVPLDLRNPLSVECFVHTYQGRPRAVLTEDLQAELGSPVRGDDGQYDNEFLVPLRSSRRAVEPAPPAPTAARPRRALPGSQWLYAKLYAGAAAADQLLLETVEPLVKAARATGQLRGWFFIRYADPHQHLRLRFHAEPTWLTQWALPAISSACQGPVADGRLWRLSFDTYLPELERYGGEAALEACEAWFEADSDCCLQLLALAPDSGSFEARWRWALAAASKLLVALLPEGARAPSLAQWRQALFDEHHGDAQLEAGLSKLYRSERASVRALLADEAAQPLVAEGLQTLGQLEAPRRALAEVLHRLEREGQLAEPLTSIAGSLVHMHVNRLLRAEPRAHELALYDLLLRHLASERGQA